MIKVNNKLMGALLALCSTLTVMLCTPCLVSAHEMYYDGTSPNWNPIPLKWNDVTNRTAKLKMNGDHLSSDYSAHYTIAKNAWPNASARVSVTEASFETSNVDLATASEEAWEDRWGVLESRDYLGVCISTSTDNYEISAATVKYSSGKIRHAAILFTPFNAYYNVTERRATMVHEIGHALGLGHPNTYYYVTSAKSIMRQGTIETYYTPQAHDINDLNAKY